MASHPVFDRDETRTFTREYISENIWNVEFTKMSQNESQFTSPWCNRSSSIVSSRGITSLRSLANEQGTPIYSAVQSRGYGLPAVRSSYFPRGNNRANYEATRTRFPSSSIYLLRAISGAAKWIGRKFAAELAGVLSPRDPSIHASGDSIDHEKYRRSLDKRSVEVATAWNTWELSESVHRERRCSLAFITVTVWNSLADSLRRSCCINTTEDRGDLFSRDLCALSLLASQIAPRRSSQRSREYFRENSRLAAASSRGLVNGDGSRSFALRQMIISSLVPEIGRSVAQGAAASSRRSAAPFDEHWAAILRQPGCVDVEKTRTRTLFFALSLSLSLRHPSALAPWPRAAPCPATPGPLSPIGCRARRTLSLTPDTRSFPRSSSLSIWYSPTLPRHDWRRQPPPRARPMLLLVWAHRRFAQASVEREKLSISLPPLPPPFPCPLTHSLIFQRRRRARDPAVRVKTR